ncbi:hypothetical protein [Gimesia sp.]|uniref:hypothetical protein n=1 Tax=Gimesia sp. TaxID=2024833 RepID=UPI003A9075A7
MMTFTKSSKVEQTSSPAASSNSVLSVCSSMFRISRKVAYYSVALFGISPLLPVIVFMYAFKILDESC